MSNILKELDLSTSMASGQEQIIVEQAGNRKVTLVRYESGMARLELAPAALRKLILSGGGAKGVAYSGAVSALEKQGVLLEIEAIYGSSAGAIMAALVASGMDAEQFDALSDDTNLLSLLDTPDKNANWFQQAFSHAGKALQAALPDTEGSFARVLLSVLPRIQSQAIPLQMLVRDKARAAVLSRITDQHPAGVVAIGERLQGGDAVTFSDLAVLSRHIPEIKSLNITGTAMLGDVAQLVVFSEALTPDIDIALAAHISAALPIVFKQPTVQGLDFQALDELTFFQDGGVLLNTPAPQLIDPGMAIDRLSGADMLILKFESEEMPGSRGGFKNLLTDWLTQASWSAERELQNLTLQTFAEQTLIVPLRTEKGDFSSVLNGTLNFTMTAEIKNHLQERLHEVVEQYLAARAIKRERHEFTSLEEALLCMDDEMLGSVVARIPSGPASETLIWRSAAEQALKNLEIALGVVGKSVRLEVTETIRLAVDGLDSLVIHSLHTNWLAQALNRSDRPALRRLLEVMRGETVTSAVMNAALVEMRKREIRVIAGNIRKAVIFPSLHLLLQTNANIRLLLRVDQLLLKAATTSDINDALNEIIVGYRSRNRLPGRRWSSKAVELAKAWRISRGDKE